MQTTYLDCEFLQQLEDVARSSGYGDPAKGNDHYQRVTDFIENYGGRRLGSGFFSTAYAVKVTGIVGDDYGHDFAEHIRVIKVCRVPDMGGLIAARAAIKVRQEGQRDPYAPLYHGIIDMGNGFWIGELEKLRDDRQGHYRTMTLGDTKQASDDMVRSSKYLLECLLAMLEWNERGRWLCENTNSAAFWDIHSDNVMVRDNGQAVVSDPIGCMFDLWDKRVSIAKALRQMDHDMRMMAARGLDDVPPADRPRPAAWTRSFMPWPWPASMRRPHFKPLAIHDALVLDGLAPLLRRKPARICVDEAMAFWQDEAAVRPANKHDPKPPRHHDHLLNINDRRIAGGKGR